MGGIRDLQHRFHVGDQHYLVDVCGCGLHPTPDFGGKLLFAQLYVCPRSLLLDHEDDGPEKVVRLIFEHFHPLLPDAIDVDQWWEFERRVHEWVCEHRAAPAIREHEED